MPEIRSVAVFCGSRPGDSPVYLQAATALGEGLARSGIALVFGGGRVGLMGAVADATLKAGGRVIGVIPDFLTRREVAHPAISELIVTETMHARKRRMFELSDAFISLPGGLGTFDETIEIITWRQLGLHAKPVLICDVAGSAEPLLAMIDSAIAHGFAAASARGLYERVDCVPALLARLGKLAAPTGGEAALL
ncbi:MAG: TIGR00730 family Rossman fold protein [Alphaproteobacteria bacterium]|nr:TIGR00730 family Rossman fold protein [Alphaproteobacteria bacterium]